MDELLAEQVRWRAGSVCEYCRMPQVFYPTVPFPIDHIIARQHAGSTAPGNLACPVCIATVIRDRTSPASTRERAG